MNNPVNYGQHVRHVPVNTFSALILVALVLPPETLSSFYLLKGGARLDSQVDHIGPPQPRLHKYRRFRQGNISSVTSLSKPGNSPPGHAMVTIAMYRLLLFMVIVGATLATDLSNISRRDVTAPLHHTEHLERARARARAELQNYFDEWVRLKARERLEALKPVTPHPPIQAPYTDPLISQKEPTPEPLFVGSTRSKDVHSSQQRSWNNYPSHSHGRDTKLNPQHDSRKPQKKHIYERQSFSDIQQPYGHGFFHLFHLHEPNGDQESWGQSIEPNKNSYSYVYGDKLNSALCVKPPCITAEMSSNGPFSNYVPPTAKPVYGYNPVFAYNQHPQQVYNPYEPIHQNNYPQTYPGYYPYQQIPPPYQGTQQTYNPYPAYQYQGTYPVGNHNMYPWINYPKPIVPPVKSEVTSNPPQYNYDQHNQNYLPPGPLGPDNQKVRPIVNRWTPPTGIEQSPSLSSSAPTLTTNSTTQLAQVTSTTADKEIAADVVEERTTNNPNGVTKQTGGLIILTVSPSEGEVSPINEVSHEIGAENVTKRNEVSEIIPIVPISPTSSPVDEMESVESSTPVTPTLGVTSEVFKTTEILEDGLHSERTSEDFVEESTSEVYPHSWNKYSTGYSDTTTEYVTSTVATYLTIEPEETEETSPASSAQEVFTKLPLLLPEITLPSTVNVTEPSIHEEESSLKEAHTADIETTFATTEIPGYTTTVKMGSDVEKDVSPYAKTAQERMTIDNEYMSSTVETTEVPVYTATMKMTEKTTSLYQGTTEREQKATVVIENAASTAVETTEVPVSTTVVQKDTIAPYPETTEILLEESTGSTLAQKALTIRETVSTTDELLTTTTETVSPCDETTQIHPEEESYETTEDTASSTEETVSTTTKPISLAAVEKYAPVKTTTSYTVTTARPPSTTKHTDASVRSSTVLVPSENLENTMKVTFRKSTEDSDEFVDTVRGFASFEPQLGFEKRFLKRLIAVVVKELRQGTMSKQDTACLKAVFGDMWPRIVDEAFYHVPVQLGEADDGKVAVRLLEYLLKGTPLARRLGKQTVQGKSFRHKRDTKLEPWQEGMLRAVAGGKPWRTKTEDNRNQAILMAIQDQLRAPEEKYDYADKEDTDNTTEVHRSGEYGATDSEYYDEEDADDAEDILIV